MFFDIPQDLGCRNAGPADDKITGPGASICWRLSAPPLQLTGKTLYLHCPSMDTS
jgi:hypothetical protein